jgi:hypothetical protein
MPETIYSNLYDITELQQKIIRYVDYWAHIEKTPIPHKKVVDEMTTHKEKNGTIIHALQMLVKLGYLRRATVVSHATETFYVLLRRL